MRNNRRLLISTLAILPYVFVAGAACGDSVLLASVNTGGGFGTDDETGPLWPAMAYWDGCCSDPVAIFEGSRWGRATIRRMSIGR